MKSYTSYLLKALACFVAFFAAQILGSCVALGGMLIQCLLTHKPFEIDSLQENPEWLCVGLVVGEALLILFLWATELIRKKPFRTTTPQIAPKWGVAVFAFIIFAIGFEFMLTPFELSDGGMQDIFDGMTGSVWGILAICIVGPICEELVFREGIQRHLQSAGLQGWLAILLSAVLFGAVHGNLMQAVPAIVTGCLLGLLYNKTGNAALCIIAHICNNSLACVQMQFPQVETFLESVPTLAMVAIGGLMLVGACALLLVWWRRKDNPTIFAV